MKKFLIIQTAFIGDVVLATPVIESLAASFPESKIDFLLRKGNENLLQGHPYIDKVFIWNKKEGKYKTLLNLLKEIREERYDYVINLQRFASTGFLTAFSKGKTTIGFKKNPFSPFFTEKIKHSIETGVHEVDRNLAVIKNIANKLIRQQKLYPSKEDIKVQEQFSEQPYVCIAPASVWFTKQLPEEKWIELSKLLASNFHICFLGAPGDMPMAERIVAKAKITNYTNFCGKLSFLKSAALM
jgi:heptosyltransferase-2